ncbi:MAG TPA: hypothetical protein VGO00_28540 [Kofleriaceae bacterium]|nr:hypothetical protein [Kofleriaceae bacterium]
MTIEWIALGYLTLGVAIAIGVVVAKRPGVFDVVLVTALWPLYAPILLVLRSGSDRRELELVDALARARSSPLAPFVPDDVTSRALGHKLRDASNRLAELDATRDLVQTRARQLADTPANAATATLRARTIAHLDDVRHRYRNELDEIDGLTAQLVAQTELVAWDPVAIDEAAELIGELVARLDRIAMTEYDAGSAGSA